MAVADYKELIAWQKAMDLVLQVYEITAKFPSQERFGLTNQLRRAAVSVPSNIAEGQGRGPSQDFIRFLNIARGSTQEVETQLILVERLGYLDDATLSRTSSLLLEVIRLISGLIRSIRPV